jgi:hypothetical protein
MLGNGNRAHPQKFGHGDPHFFRSNNIDLLVVGAKFLNKLEPATAFLEHLTGDGRSLHDQKVGIL